MGFYWKSCQKSAHSGAFRNQQQAEAGEHGNMAFLKRIKKYLHADNPGQLKRELLWLLAHVRQYRKQILMIGVLGLVGTVMGLAAVVASKYLIDAVTGFGAGLLIRSAILMGITMIGSLIFQAISSRVSADLLIRATTAPSIQASH